MNFVKNIDINNQLTKAYHGCSLMNKDFICEFCGKTFISTINEERQIIALHLEINTIVVNVVEKDSYQLSI